VWPTSFDEEVALRTRSGLLALVFAAGAVVSAGPAGADIYLSGEPGARETTCAGSYDTSEASCTFPAIGGRTFVLGGYGSGAFVISLEVAGGNAGSPGSVIAWCEGVGGDGCVGGSGHNGVPVPAGTTLTCRAWGVGAGTFECSSFQID
jgi:hypothetical protein